MVDEIGPFSPHLVLKIETKIKELDQGIFNFVVWMSFEIRIVNQFQLNST